jgi:type IV pilus assembly protein PilM
MDLNLSLEGIRRGAGRLATRLAGGDLSGLRMFRPQYPPLAVEVGETGLALVHVDRGLRGASVLRRYRQMELPEGAMDLQFGRANMTRPAEVGAAMLRYLEQESIEVRNVSLVLPDHLARVALIHLGERPATRHEALELIRWKLRKSVPFKVEEAHIDYQLFASPGDGGAWLCLATLMPQVVLDQYERLFRDLGMHVGLIDLSTFNLANLALPLLARDGRDAYVLNVTGSFFALMVLREGSPLFYRAKSYAFADDPSRESRRSLLLRELDGSLAYCRERLGGEAPSALHLRCVDLDLEAVTREVQERTGVAVEPIDPGRLVKVVPREGGAEAQRRLLQRIAPALGAALGRES